MSQEVKKQKRNLQRKPPVVVVLGHVDHGKTALLDYIRKSNVVEKESGGITQHIGAYEIEYQGKKITFIDTPGHEAFSAIRSRGAKVADIAVLVVAGDDGVKEQTKEAINHIKKAGIPMIVAINKMDKPEANSEKVKRELSLNGVLVESMGGKVPCVEISAKTGKGISDLLELILLVAEMEGLKADIFLPAQGTIIESFLDDKKGPIATLILEQGKLKQGDILGTPSTFGRVRTLENFQGKSIKSALPSMPVVVLGFEKVPRVGEKFKVFEKIEEAQEQIKEKEKEKEEPLREVVEIKEGKKVLNLILKADVYGSLEAIEEVLKELPQEKVVLRILKAEVGQVTDSDVKLAKSANAKIIGFRVKTSQIAKNLALREKVTIINFEVIYDLAQAVRQLLKKTEGTEVITQELGKVKILAIFRQEKNRQIVGGKVIEGKIKRGVNVEVLREEEKIGEGKVSELQKNKKEVDEVEKGAECGILYLGDVKIEQGDILRAYTKVAKKIGV